MKSTRMSNTTNFELFRPMMGSWTACEMIYDEFITPKLKIYEFKRKITESSENSSHQMKTHEPSIYILKLERHKRKKR
jgi:hypothetical protein